MKNHPVHYPEDTLRLLNRHPQDRANIFLALPDRDRHTIWLRLSRAAQRDLVGALSDADLVMLMESVDPDQATDILQFFAKKRRAHLFSLLSERLQEYLTVLLPFDPETAAGVMDLDYIQVEDTATIAGVSKHFKEHERRTGRAPVILAVCAGKLRGYLPGHELGLRRQNERITAYCRPLPTISSKAGYKEIIQVFRDHPHNKVVVINANEQVLGVMYSDDVLRLMHEDESSALLSFAGVQNEEAVADPASAKVRHRYKWLIVNLGTAFLAAFTVGLFEETIAAHVLLAVYMPIVAGMGGNAATQTLAVMVRGIALKQITLRTAMKTFKNEIFAGLLNGMMNGVIVGAVVYALHRDLALAIVLSLAMVVNLLVAGAFGTLIPLIMKRLGKDPATSATIFITTATDVIGFLAFLGLATVLLS